MEIKKVKYTMCQCQGKKCKNFTIDYHIFISKFLDIELCKDCFNKLKNEMERIENEM
jgi:hypothetical protein